MNTVYTMHIHTSNNGFKNSFIQDPVTLYGEGQFTLHGLKDISVTKSFMGLKRHIRKCQIFETYDDCKREQYLNHMKQKCGCLPWSVSLSEQVPFLF